VAGAAAGASSRFQLQVLSPPDEVVRTGQIRLRSTGEVRGERRTVEVSIGKPSFMEYLYFSVYETSPPITARDPDWAATNCSAAFATRNSSCDNITFSDGDDFTGPVYSEDRILMSGSPIFRQRVETAWTGQGTAPDGGPFWAASGAATPSFLGGAPRRATVRFPDNNTRLAAQARAGNGCVYTGPTRIMFNSNGTMTVTSPYSGNRGTCGNFLGSGPDFTRTVPVPDNQMVLVENGAGACDPAARAAVRFPIAGDNALDGSGKLAYTCSQGDAFVEGQLRGRLTVQAENNVVITGNLTYATGVNGTDMLGLVGDNAVAVYRPVACSTTTNVPSQNIVNGRSPRGRCEVGTDVSRPLTNADAPSTTQARIRTAYPASTMTVHAVILATENGFLVQNALIGGAQGNLTVHGAIAQKFRGFIGGRVNGVHARGYVKNYGYDVRAAFSPPPYMADLALSAWGVRQFAERTGG
jgi:hypothetical protein